MNTLQLILLGFGFGMTAGLIVALLLVRNYLGSDFNIKRLVNKGKGNDNLIDVTASQEKKERRKLFNREKKN